MGFSLKHFPLYEYHNKKFYIMRNDALDRFGTRIEKRFTLAEIIEMMKNAGLENIRHSPEPPYWCAVGYKKG
jgi:hypothetical protein